MTFETVDISRKESDDFVLGAVNVSYRLPDSRGAVSLEITNAFDEEVGLRERPSPARGAASILDPVFPRDVILFARATLSF